MELYHGSLQEVKTPIISANSKIFEYGRGFYVTESLQDARRWVQKLMKEAHATEGYINTYEFDRKAMDSLNCLIFKKPNKEWLKFVMDNRTKRDFSHDYDIILGPAVNDDAYEQLIYAEGDIFRTSSILEDLRSFRLMDQYLFHTPRALEALQYVDSFPPVTSKCMQDDLHLFTPTKVRWLVEYLHDDYDLSIEESLDRIYHSELYKKLSTESTQYWHLGPVDLYNELLEEFGDLGKEK